MTINKPTESNVKRLSGLTILDNNLRLKNTLYTLEQVIIITGMTKIDIELKFKFGVIPSFKHDNELPSCKILDSWNKDEVLIRRCVLYNLLFDPGYIKRQIAVNSTSLHQ